MPNPYHPPASADSETIKDDPRTPWRYRFLAVLVAFLVGGGAAFGIGFLFITTPVQFVLGPRYSEFDFFGVIGVTIIVPFIALVGTAIAVQQGTRKLRATFRPLNLLSLIGAPLIFLIALALFVDGGWAWMAVIHLATCVGILSAAKLALHLTPAP